MSRIGKKAITLSDQINMTIENNIIIIEGPKGTLSQKISKSINLTLDNLHGNKILSIRPHDD